jgi:hypothetical protein
VIIWDSACIAVKISEKRNHLEDVCKGGSIVLKCDLKKYCGRLGSGFFSLMLGGSFVTTAHHKLINSVSNKEKLPYQWKEYINIYLLSILLYYCIEDKEMVYHHCFSTLLQNMPLRRSKKIW